MRKGTTVRLREPVPTTMRMKLTLLVSLLAFALISVVGVSSADAFVWQMRYGQAKNATKNFAKESCAEDSECLGWGTGQCYRRSDSHFACEMGLFFSGVEPEEEIECDVVLHWGASRDGYIVLKRHGPPHCFPR
jgi:hypothetical protein